MTNSPAPMQKPVIGLMGGPGSGKSTVAGLFGEMGCAVIDADRLAHAALQVDGVKREIRERWGEGVLNSQGEIDRAALGKIVFEDEAALKHLESIVHPLVHEGRQREREQHQADPSVVAIVEDCPLLIESGLDKDCDALVFIDCADPIRLERVANSRGWDAVELKKRDEQQLPLDTKRRSADYVISNDETLARVREQVEHVLQQLVK